MSDPLLAAAWLGFLAIGLLLVGGLRALGLPSTHARDLVHVGAGSWVLGWPWWEGRAWPLGIAYGAVLVAVGLPRLLPDSAPARALRHTLATGAETWTGVALYTVSVAAFTTLGLAVEAFPAGAALLALALGDGLGGAVGLRFGRHRFRVPGAKQKTIEGSVAVGVFAAVGVSIAGLVLGASTPPLLLVLSGLVAAGAEALSPRSSDNLLLPAAVWVLLEVIA